MLLAAGCATRHPDVVVEDTISIAGLPTRWIDLPESPFRTSVSKGTAQLINRSERPFKAMSVGCVRPVDGMVVVELVMFVVEHASVWNPYRQVDVFGSTMDIERNENYCAADLRVAVTEALDEGGSRWSAAGTVWPGPEGRVGSHRRPQFAYGESRGCFDIDVFSFNRARTEVFSVVMDINPEKPPTERKPRVVNLARPPKGTSVEVLVYQTDTHDWPCTDVSFFGAERPTTWVARRGTLTVFVTGPKHGGEYPVTVRLVNAEFVGPAGVVVRPPAILEIKTLAGRFVSG